MLPETNTNDSAEDSICNDANGRIHDEENNFQINSKDDFDIELISAARAAVSVCYFFRANNLIYSIFFVILASHFVGKWMEKILPNKKFRIKNWEFNLNPGPFNYKEHVCVAAAASAGGVSAYAVDVIAIQELFYNTRVSFLVGFLLLISTQMIGYGLAGFVRKYLVRPANMIWPKSLVYAAMYNTLHGNTSQTNHKFKFFAIAFISMFVWQFVPEYIFPWLASAAILCLIAPNNTTIKTLGSSYRGAGILNFSLDWNAIGQVFPMFTPWWSQVNYYIGVVLVIWVIDPLLYFNNVFDAKKFTFASTHSFDKYGNIYNQTKIMDPVTGTLNVTAYENYSPVYMSIVFVMSYFFFFMQVPATICHVILFHGKEIWSRYKKTREEEEEADIHCKMMNVYPGFNKVPYYWYGTIFFVMLIIAIILGYTTGANLPWWGVLLAVVLAVVMVLPIGIIQAISNWQLGLNVMTELVCGFLLPGYPIANVYFKTYGYRSLTQCLLFIQDLKLGHYMKIPPRSMFIAQIWGTIIGIIVNYWTLNIIINTKRSYIDGTEADPTGQWAGLKPEIFNTASIVWGLIGPARTFGSGSIYNVLLWGFLIGGFLPIPFYLLHRKFPKAKFNLVNTPVILFGLTVFPETYPNFIITGLIASFLSQFYAWWKKYNYVMSAAFDSGAQIMTMVAFVCFSGVVKVQFPTWWGNDPSTQSEHCFPINS
ncbi:9793_t:CDS:10 [Dentiscutata erythropus]|uniref:9793_t:CDS:1 n=1 Tax=Dentiscutata erythropus TaxID=1348616 RepID=A0A9N9J3Q9_9GLOM|nr:9793_t:CDS:10 [Dentiscutata erythropus]